MVGVDVFPTEMAVSPVPFPSQFSGAYNQLPLHALTIALHRLAIHLQ